MCGLVGLLDCRESRPVDPSLLTRMNDALWHRGPDGHGSFIQPGIGLGHRRLSIIDLTGGQQPIYNEDRSVVVVFNGEIYNFKSLRQQLQSQGHRFTTDTDSEVIVHAWEQWGQGCVNKFRGMFAFALYDMNQKLLFLARDRLGIKPLYYTLLKSGWLIFASELKSLVLHPDMEKKLNPIGIIDYFSYGYIPDPDTIYQGIYKLPPGHTLCVPSELKTLPTPRMYWDLPAPESESCSTEIIASQLIDKIDQATQIRLMSDVPLGAFLSGGIDSSCIVASMSRLMNEPVKTSSISFDNAQYNEAPYFNAVAQLFQTDQVEEQVEINDFSLIDRLAQIYDEPFADSSALPTYRVCESAAKRVKVALSGDGGDEHFAGYRRYKGQLREEKMRGIFPTALRVPLFSLLAKLYPKGDFLPRVFRAKATFEALAHNTIEGYFNSIAILKPQRFSQALSLEFRRSLNGYHPWDKLKFHGQNCPRDDPLSLIQYLDIKTYLPGDILTKVDRASMAHSLEVRVPLLDHALVEWVWQLDPHLKLHGQSGKYILKKALAKRLPKQILHRRKKGFSVPIGQWFKGPLNTQLQILQHHPAFEEISIFKPAYIQRCVQQHLKGTRDHSAFIWALFSFAKFYENTFVNSQVEPHDARTACA